MYEGLRHCEEHCFLLRVCLPNQILRWAMHKNILKVSIGARVSVYLTQKICYCGRTRTHISCWYNNFILHVVTSSLYNRIESNPFGSVKYLMFNHQSFKYCRKAGCWHFMIARIICALFNLVYIISNSNILLSFPHF